jgi:hypothetical protein
MDSDRKVSFAEFETVVGVFRRPDKDSERDGGDQNENDAEFDESLHGEPLCLRWSFLRQDWQHSFQGYHTLRRLLSAQGSQESSQTRHVLLALFKTAICATSSGWPEEVTENTGRMEF